MKVSRRQFVRNACLFGSAIFLHQQRALANALEQSGLKDSFKSDFLIGSIMGARNMLAARPEYLALITKEFNSMTMENAMKWENIHPSEKIWRWDAPDKFVDFGQQNHMKLVGHVLVWHSQMANSAFRNKKGNYVNRKTMIKVMKKHISTLVGRYKNKMWAWDVVNEAIDDDKGLRQSDWLKVIGDDFMDLAFNFAHDADPKANLIYNDYNMHMPGKREFLVNWIKAAKKRGVPINGVGMQGHIGLDFPDLQEFEDSIVAYAKAGMRVHITELEVDVLPAAWEYTGAEISKNFEYSDQLNPWVNGLPQEMEDKLTARYVEIFKLFLKHRDKIDRVTFWGTSDIESWKNDFPVKGRTNYPLLFDRQYQPKPAYTAVRNLKK